MEIRVLTTFTAQQAKNTRDELISAFGSPDLTFVVSSEHGEQEVVLVADRNTINDKFVEDVRMFALGFFAALRNHFSGK